MLVAVIEGNIILSSSAADWKIYMRLLLSVIMLYAGNRMKWKVVWSDDLFMLQLEYENCREKEKICFEIITECQPASGFSALSFSQDYCGTYGSLYAFT